MKDLSSISGCAIIMFAAIVGAAMSSAVVSVQGPVSVSRGGSVDLRPSFQFNLDSLPQGLECRITNIAGSCGAIMPSIFACDYPGSIVYQHFGCYSDKELASVSVSILASSYTPFSPGTVPSQPPQVSVHSVEVSVSAASSSLAALRLDTVQRNKRNGSLHLRVVFPSEMAGRCYYEVLSGWPQLSLPITGHIEGTLNQVLPSGYVPTPPLIYHPHSRTGEPLIDYILIKLYSHEFELNSASVSNTYRMLPFSVYSASAETKVRELSRDILIIRQSFNTPIFWSDFRSFNLTLNLTPSHASDMSVPTLRYTFPVLDAGSFHSLSSASSPGLSFSSFTTEELLAGQVAFCPIYDHTSNNMIYHYNITNTAGVTIARGEMSVSTNSVNNQPLQRRNRPLAVAEGGMTAINDYTIDFYTFTVACTKSITIRALRFPVFGELVYSDGTTVGGEEIRFDLLAKSAYVSYRHFGGEAFGDAIHWEVKCPSPLDFKVFMSVLVAAVDDAPPTVAAGPTTQSQPIIHTYRDWIIPLSPSFLPVMDPDSSHHDIHFTVKTSGGFYRIDVLDTIHFPLFPFVPYNSFSPSNFYKVSNFSLLDLEEQRIWYQVEGDYQIDQVEVILHDSADEGEVNPKIYLLYINVSSLPPKHSLVISTSTLYPYILKNKSLPLSHDGHMYLTPYFLYSRAPPTSPRSVRYVVETPPLHGRLCSTSNTQCENSVGTFTQEEISSHRLIYRPNSEDRLIHDHFTFITTVEGIAHINPTLLTFNWTVLPSERVNNKPFWLDWGTARPLPPEFLHHLTSQLQIDGVTFRVLVQPQYGELMLRNDTHIISLHANSFTWEQAQLLWYNHTHLRGTPRCGDRVKLEATAQNGSGVVGYLQIAFRTGLANLSVHTNPHQLLGLSPFHFSSKDMVITSSFCPEFVEFTIQEPPSQGTLSLQDHTYNTERELSKGSMFTAQDVMLQRLIYTRSVSDSAASGDENDGFTIRSSDPTSEWPPIESEDQSVLIIGTSPQDNYFLEVVVSEQHALTWLHRQHTYGYVFTPYDIDLLNSTLRPSEVVVQVEGALTWGTLQNGDVIVSTFTLADLQDGGIVYLRNSLHLEAVFEERMVLGLYAHLPHFTRRVCLHHFVMEWAVVGMELSEVSVSEEDGFVNLSVTRMGPTWFESRVQLNTISGPASSQEDCSLPAHSLSGDFCHLEQEVVFAVGVVLQEVSVRIVNDVLPEEEEFFYVQLVEGEVTSALLHGNVRSKVIITNREDYNIFGIVGEAGPTQDCILEVDVEEDSSQLILNLTRQGNMDQEVGVVCATEADTAIANADYVPRPHNSLGSEVMFGVNQSLAQCVVGIIDDKALEPRERFHVYLTASSRHSAVNIDHTSSSICIHIRYAENDGPEVIFNPTEVSVQESETMTTSVTFTMDRVGQDLSTTSEVKYYYFISDGDSAEENVDFRLYTDDGCMLLGDNSGGCVRFSPGLSSASLKVQILPDKLLEGDEVFHLKIGYVRNGRRSKDLRKSTLKITIIDGASPSFVGFVNHTTTLLETSRSNRIPIRRSGHLSTRVDVFCSVKGITAQGPFNDFIASPKPSRVTFHHNVTDGHCNLLIRDDTDYEGLESLMISLEPKGGESHEVYILPDYGNITIYISDPEDAPMVQFTSSCRHVSEPLSNSVLDRSTLTLHLVRSGDISLPSNVTYAAIDESAKAGEDFDLTSGMITFTQGQNTSELVIVILANHKQRYNTSFAVELSSMTSDLTTTIGTNNSVAVLIEDVGVSGPYFPALPQLCNVAEGGGVEACAPQQLYFDLPLTCITACDLSFDPEIWRAECERQGVENEDTVYMWEVSTETNTSFHSIHATSQELQTLHLQPHLQVRCRAQAVNKNGVKGYSRMSETAELSIQRYDCYGNGSPQGTVHSYEGFVGADQDVLLVALTLPAQANSIPIFSTLPLSLHNITRLLLPTQRDTLPPCSSLSAHNDVSLLSHSLQSPVQWTYNRSKCEWYFSRWYSVNTILRECGGVGERPNISITAMVPSLRVGVEGELTITSNHTVTLSLADIAHTDSMIPPSLHVLSTSGDALPYLFPLSLRINAGNMEMFIRLVSSSDTTLKPIPLNGQRFELLTSDTLRRSASGLDVGKGQTWLIQTPNLPHVDLRFSEYIFSLPLGDGGGGGVGLLLNVNVEMEQDSLIIGEGVAFTATLSPQQQLLGNHTLHIQQLYLCEQVHSDNCSNRLTVLRNGDRFAVEMKHIDAHIVSMEFSTDSIVLLNSPSQWFLHVRFGLSKSSLFQDVTLPFLLFSPPPPTTPPTLVFTQAFVPVPIYITIAALTTVVLVLVVGVAMAVGVACMIQGRSKFHEKRRSDQVVREKLNSTRTIPPPVQVRHAIKRTRSTIGFPTQEYRIKTTPMTTPMPRKQLKPFSNAGLHRSLSLPSVLTSRAGGRSLCLPAPYGKRVNPNRGHIRIKKLNKDCSWTTQQLKELENLDLVQVKHKHYGVNEIQQGSSQLRTGPYARFAVRNLAVSAKTPEPGSRPFSVL